MLGLREAAHCRRSLKCITLVPVFIGGARLSKALGELQHGNVSSPCKAEVITQVYKSQLLCLFDS